MRSAAVHTRRPGRELPPMSFVCMLATAIAAFAILHAGNAEAAPLQGSPAAQPACPKLAVAMNGQGAYVGVNGGTDRMVEVLASLTEDLGYHVLFMYGSRGTKFPRRLNVREYQHPRLVIHDLNDTLAERGLDLRHSVSTAVNSLQALSGASLSAHCEVVVLQFIWAFDAEFVGAIEHIHRSLAQSLRGMRLRTFSVYEDDCIERGRAEAATGVGTSLDEVTCRTGATLPGLHGVFCISWAVCSSLHRNIPEMPSRSAVLPFTLSTLPQPNHASYDDCAIDYLFMGNSNQGNIDSVEWLCKEFVPHMNPNEHLFIYGWVSKPQFMDKAGCSPDLIEPAAEATKSNQRNRPPTRPIVTYSFVADDDLTAAISKARILLAPTLVPTGVSTKVVRAIALGTPVVTTEQGADGVRAQLEACGHEAMLEVELDGLTAAATALNRDKFMWDRMQQACLACAKEAFSRAVHVTPVLAKLPAMDEWSDEGGRG